MSRPALLADLGPLDLAILAAYLVAMVAVGLAVTFRIRRFWDYFLAGGTLTTPLLVCTLVSTYYEIDVTFAVSEVAHDSGLVAWFWWSRPYYVAILAAAFVVTGRLRRRGSFATLPDVLEASYGRAARAAGAAACAVYSLPITALAGMIAVFELMGWSRGGSLLAALGACAVYTTFGGLWADAITGTVQFVLMCLAVAVAIPAALDLVGGFGFVDRLPAEHLTASGGVSPWLILAWSAAALAVLVEPAFYQRILAAREERSVRRALLIGVVLWASYDWGVTLLGMIARAAVASGLLPDGLEGRHALMSICLTALPAGLKGFFVAGVLAAAMSSVDSYTLLASGNVVYDVYRPFFRPEIPDAALLRLTRLGVVVLTLASALAALAFDRIADAWIFMAGILPSAVLVPVMGALYGRPPRAAGLAGILAGLGGYAAFQVIVHTLGVHDPAEGSWKLVVGGAEIWRECAVLFALPASAAGFAAGRWMGGRAAA
jgi:SSS family solute:Na+ symporter